MGIYNFMRLILAFFWYLPVERSKRYIYYLVMANSALTGKEGSLLPTSSHNLARSMFETVRKTNHTIDKSPRRDVMTF